MKRGVWPIVTNVGRGMRWTRLAQATNALQSRTAKSWRPDTPTLVSSRRDDPSVMVARKPGSPGRPRRKPLKPAARGMPGVSGEARGDYTRVLFVFAREAAGALKHPAFPAPSDCGGHHVKTRVRNSAGTRRHVLSTRQGPLVSKYLPFCGQMPDRGNNHAQT